MATKRTQRTATARTSKAKATQNGKPVALTLKVDERTYVRLCAYGARQRRTNQDILCEALQEYLKRLGA